MIRIRNIQSAKSFKNTNVIFSNFYSRIKDSNKYSVQEKNRLLKEAVYFQETLIFLKSNRELFYHIRTTSTTPAYSALNPVVDGIFGKIGHTLKHWWHHGGKCESGVIGGAITGGLAGCTITVLGCPIGATLGATLGAIGGALLGAVAGCR